ncbi:CRE-MVK-1 protein [Caenorhabditis remanei]|uniref:CRE-MVK-1 protein n=1 Tax=Caenorhabditis remanei TaxID=31234 RepID=E3LWP3_CAERE|nr:CRE-MVK-1 protein [Caenorhabditis remanei]
MEEKTVTVCGEMVRSLDANGKEMVIRREVSMTETRESSLKVEIPSEDVNEDSESSTVKKIQEPSVTSVESIEIPVVKKDSLDSPSGSTSRAGSSVSATASPMHRNTTSQHGGLFVSAPGKIILFGEHAVVYGRTAIAGSIDLRTYVSLYTSADGRIYLSLPDLGVEKTWMLKDLLKAADRLAAEYPIEEDQPPSLEILVPIARKLSGSCEDQCGVQHLAILAFWYLLLGVAHRKSGLNRLARGLPAPPLPEGLHRTNLSVMTNSHHLGGDADRSEAEIALSLPVPPLTPLPSPGAQSSAPPAFPVVSPAPTPTPTSTPTPLLPGNLRADSPAVQQDLLAVKATVRFKLPSCVGLGSSGAYCVCIATSLLQTAGLIPPPTIVADEQGNLTWEEEHLDMIRKWATAAESLIHGRASGLDAAVCTFGGVASFKPGHPIEHLKNLPDLRVILVNSKVERNTARMVQTVKERLKKFPEVVDAMFGSIDAISLDAAKILHRPLLEENGGGDSASTVQENGLGPFGGNMVEQDHHSLQPTRTGSVRSSSLSSYVGGGKRNSSASVISATSEKGENVDTFSKLNDLCRINNQLLIALGVGHPKVDLICTTLARYGIHPKMTGAGGGGSVFAFLKPNTPQTLLDMIDGELRSLGFEVWQPPLGGPGVVEHQTRPELFQTPVSSTQCSTPASKHK